MINLEVWGSHLISSRVNHPSWALMVKIDPPHNVIEGGCWWWISPWSSSFCLFPLCNWLLMVDVVGDESSPLLFHYILLGEWPKRGGWLNQKPESSSWSSSCQVNFPSGCWVPFAVGPSDRVRSVFWESGCPRNSCEEESHLSALQNAHPTRGTSICTGLLLLHLGLS